MHKRGDEPREPNDFYVTPPETTKALMDREYFDGWVWECACGNGAMSEVIKHYVPHILSTDLIDRGYGSCQDFLAHNPVNKYDNIITNPPFKLALEFVEHAKKVARKKIAMLLKVVFLESAKRYQMFQDREFPLKVVYVFSRRQTIAIRGEQLENSGMVAYAWFVWDKEHKGKPTIEWIL